MRRFIAIIPILMCALGHAEAQGSLWPAPEDGDMLHLAYATGPRTGNLFLRYQHDREESSGETFVTSRVHGLYGLTDWMVLGLSLPYHEQRLGDLHKKGPGDVSIQARLHGPLAAEHALRGGLRLSASLPTGYDEENPPLAPFTSRTHDLLLEGIVQWEGPHLALVASPGVWLPGGSKSMALTGGVGLDWQRGIPLGLRLRAEYFSRYDIVDETFHSVVFGGLRRDLFWGLGAEIGAHRDLLAGGDAPATWSLRFSMGDPIPRHVPSREEAVVRPVTFIIEPPRLEGDASDPNGFLDLLESQILARLSESPLGIARPAGSRLPERHGREVTVEAHLVRLIEGNDRGLSIPHILASPYATLDVTLRVVLRDGVHGPVLDETLIHARLRRGTGMEILPIGSDDDRWVPPPEARRALMESAARRVAQDLGSHLAAVIEALEG